MLVLAVTSVLVTNLLFLAAAVVILRRFQTPPGTFTLLYGLVAFAMTGLAGFDQLLLVLPAALGGVVADVLASRTRPVVVASVVPAVMWPAFFAVAHHAYDVGMAAELWTGAVFLAILTGAGLSVFADYASIGRRASAV
jgi:hypothetical protein